MPKFQQTAIELRDKDGRPFVLYNGENGSWCAVYNGPEGDNSRRTPNDDLYEYEKAQDALQNINEPFAD
jgi:hypothetical protein